MISLHTLVHVPNLWPSQVLGCLGRRSLRGHIRLGHTTVHYEVGRVHKAALVAGEENDCMRLLDGLAKASGGEVDLAPEPLLLVVSQPVLQQRCAASCQRGASFILNVADLLERSWAERVKAES